MKKYWPFVIVGLTAVGCLKTSTNKPTIQSFNSADTVSFYFQLKSFEDTSWYIGHDTFRVSWYSKQLRALQEPILYDKKIENEIFRFTWLRTFHKPVVIRIEKQDKNYLLFWKMTDGKGGYEPGKIIMDNSRKITNEDWDSFLEALEKTDFWNMNTMDEKFSGNDGSRWILEGLNSKRYHVVDRWTPRKNEYFNCGDFLLKLTGLDLTEKEIY